ncbi:amino acid permease [Pseudobacteriovorax antillogorgiicola]|uniref:Transporter, cation-chloride cotransporter (CCC) family n=1 Tax=Pseudobacteriovorax antillogorgiicola TaxID=1513793 RepID=A0A1Y6CNI8_9BACT|nr:amino acid permease [Pseudobacteriovorax antillogorgiicola]TCS44985.1 cation-chloride cotransporter (CCC family) [Pseudobacteriovorax antillogorgiicola]SMF76669.1 transporter, cation-chloride cotransporter (CCC) family [Pseudobacteriovorax antillogorgiicola]
MRRKRSMTSVQSKQEISHDEAQQSLEIISSAAGSKESPIKLRKLGTYVGVFRPTILTIFGVMMYIRMGWVVGHAGLMGALLILFMTFIITGTAALSFSSITTNIRLRAGGVFALVSQSLGLEAGGAVGLPLYLAQSLGASLYIYGFAEGWTYLFPDHDSRIVVACTFLCGLILSIISENLALKMQSLVLIGVVFALGSMIGGFWGVEEFRNPQLWGDFEAGSIWILFAIFFPAGTGIKVGASLSGKLEDSRRSIPLGTMSAWIVALITYGTLMVWYSVVASPQELQSNYLIATEYSLWGPAVLIGLLSSCFSATLSSLVAAPNVLAALGQNKIIPKGDFIAKESVGGTPRNAMVINGIFVGISLLLGDLNRVAALITMFFLLTYATLNIVVLIEQSLNLVSFRPTFKVPIWVPALGTITSVFAITVIHPIFGLMALAIVIALYIYLERRQLETPWETVRSGIFIGLADWAARQVQSHKTEGMERAWKPDILVPIKYSQQLQGEYRFLLSLVAPKGSIQALTVRSKNRAPDNKRLAEIIDYFRAEGLFATHALVDSNTIDHGVEIGISILKGSFFKPNILYIDTSHLNQEEIAALFEVAHEHQMGVAMLVLNGQTLFGREREINIWIRDQSPDWTLGLRLANLDLAILLGYQLNRNWKGKINLVTVINKKENIAPAHEFLHSLAKDARLPTNTDIFLYHGEFENQIEHAPRADVNIFGLSRNIGPDRLRDLAIKTNSSCLFVLDSGNESALA